RVMLALEGSRVPVPRVLHLCTDESVIGSVFYLMEYVEGDVFWDPALPKLDWRERGMLYREMCGVLASLHKVDPARVGLLDFGKPGNYFERQISRWTKQYQASETEVIPQMDYLIQWLPNNLPADDGQVALVHGDYRLDNMLFNPETKRVSAVLDWELSTLGHPFADLAYQCMQLRMSHETKPRGLGNIDRRALGIPSEREYVAMYCDLMGIRKIDHWPFYLAFSFFRFAAILQGVKKRAIDGNASSQTALDYGELVHPIAQLGINAVLDDR
ncbi:MAG: phosphotransferase family protein, partial [Pseudomonadota bacterium]